MLRKQNDDETSSEIEFIIRDDLIYRIEDTKRLCISSDCEKEIFELIHNQNNHVKHNRVYTRLMKSVYISRLNRKIREYIKHCSTCELNQIKKHASYEKLMSIVTQMKSFTTIAIDFIVILARSEVDAVLTITCKTSKRITLISKLTTWKVHEWIDALLKRLLIADWKFFERIIFDKDSKFLSDFWKAMFKKLKTNLLLFTTYYSQTDEQSKRTNQIVKITLRYFIAKNPEKD